MKLINKINLVIRCFLLLLLFSLISLKLLDFSDTSGSQNLSLSLSSEWRSSTELSSSRAPPTGWMNTMPLSSNMSTISRRSSGGRSGRRENHSESFVKGYVKKRNLILGLLVKMLFLF